jgi:hypothetical protein
MLMLVTKSGVPSEQMFSGVTDRSGRDRLRARCGYGYRRASGYARAAPHLWQDDSYMVG